MPKCSCKICKRHRRLRYVFNGMKKRNLPHVVDFFENLIEDFEIAEFELDWITSGTSKEYLSTKEVMKQFNISEEDMREFLKNRRDRIEE